MTQGVELTDRFGILASAKARRRHVAMRIASAIIVGGVLGVLFVSLYSWLAIVTTASQMLFYGLVCPM